MSPRPDDPNDSPLRPRVRFRLRPGVRVPVAEDPTAELRELAPSAWEALVQRYGPLKAAHLFPPGELARLLRRAERLSPRFDGAPLARWFHLVLPAGSAGPEAHDHVRALPVDAVEVETTLGTLPCGGYSGEPEYASQQHLHASPLGVSLPSVFDAAGGRGQDQVLFDLERGWDTTHPDFTGLTLSLLPGGVALTDPETVEHGTNTLGVVAARLNAANCLGVASAIPKVFLVSDILASSPGTAPDTASAIKEVLGTSAPGDVLLIELHKDPHIADGSIPPDSMKVPVEVLPSVAETIRLAVALHVVVVEAAGNGGETADVDLDDLVVNGEKPFSPEAPDSGAILVGQAMWDGAKWLPLQRGCHGRRVDCFASGRFVVTSSTKASKVSKSYDGTSSASAIVAGVALVVQGMKRALPGAPYFPPLPMRHLLSDPARGTLAAGGLDASGEPADGIGVMPDLAKVGVALGVLPDVYLRDHPSDSGEPHSGPLSMSPDIIVRTNVPADPIAAFGPGPNENRDDLSEPVQASTPATLFVRVKNRGAVDAVGAKAQVFWTPTATLVQPWSWTEVAPPVVLPDVAAAGPIVVSPPIAWPNPPAPGHYCFVAVVGHPNDPVLDPTTQATLDDFATYLQWIRTENGITWRNFNVVSAPPTPAPPPPQPSGYGGRGGPPDDEDEDEDEVDDERESARRRKDRPEWRLPFDALGAADAAREMALLVRAALPTGSTVHLALPIGVMDALGLAGTFDAASDVALVPLAEKGATPLGALTFAIKQRIPMALRVHVPQKAWGATMEIAVIQEHAGQEVGRITWRLSPPVSPPSDPS